MKMAEESSEEILSLLTRDSRGLPDICKVRAEELKDSLVSKYKWIKNGFNLMTVKSRAEKRFYGIYENSFSKPRDIFDEQGRVSLCSKKR